METVVTQNQEEDDEQRTSFIPVEIISDILTRLPTKPLLQFKSVSKQWHSLISSPSFIKHHSITNTGYGFYEHDFAFVINPSTRKYVKLNAPGSVSVYNYGNVNVCYFFGYDESRNEHKVLNITLLKRMFEPISVEIFLFEFSSFERRKIDAEIPVDDISGETWYESVKRSVCVNSVIHLMLARKSKILAFDLRTEMFEIIKIPNEAVPCDEFSFYSSNNVNSFKFNRPILMKVNGFLGVICHDRFVESNEMDIWMLKDYEERVWVKETIVFGESWVDVDEPFLLGVLM